MIRDGSSIADGTILHSQVCIVGTGPAGVTAAWYLQDAGYDVTLIEGSRIYANYKESWRDKVLLYNGQNTGLLATSEPDFLVLPDSGNQNTAWERERTYGGTSTHWGGQSRPEDPIDLLERPHFMGWPFGRAELDPYYKQAVSFCALHGPFPDDFTAEYWATVLQADVPKLQGFDTSMYQYIGSGYLNFATRTFPNGTTIGATKVDVIRNATLLEIEHRQGRVQRLRVASMTGGSTPESDTEFFIEADVYVLACGAVANAQQLLLSNAGNEHDLVGRYFTCHPITPWGTNVVTVTKPFTTYDQDRLMSGTTKSGVQWSDSNGVRVSGRFIPDAEETLRLGIGRIWYNTGNGGIYFEVAPNFDNRITLADTVDPVFHQPQAHIAFDVGDLDEQTYVQSSQLFEAAVTALGGAVSFMSWSDFKDTLWINGHHIGTTRMASDPTKGVVDEHQRVHSLQNLYVAGASVFPNAGISNPTFTIITLSIRLAEHLAKKLGPPA